MGGRCGTTLCFRSQSCPVASFTPSLSRLIYDRINSYRVSDTADRTTRRPHACRDRDESCDDKSPPTAGARRTDGRGGRGGSVAGGSWKGEQMNGVSPRDVTSSSSVHRQWLTGDTWVQNGIFSNAVVTTTIRLRFDRRATTIRRPTLRP